MLWGNQPVANDSRGGYYRAFYADPRWLWDAGVDYTAPIDGDATRNDLSQWQRALPVPA